MLSISFSKFINSWLGSSLVYNSKSSISNSIASLFEKVQNFSLLRFKITTCQKNAPRGSIAFNKPEKLSAPSTAIAKNNKAIVQGNKVTNTPGSASLGSASLDLGPIPAFSPASPFIKKILKQFI